VLIGPHCPVAERYAALETGGQFFLSSSKPVCHPAASTAGYRRQQPRFFIVPAWRRWEDAARSISIAFRLNGMFFTATRIIAYLV
jgi:hypothetical protein